MEVGEIRTKKKKTGESWVKNRNVWWLSGSRRLMTPWSY